MAFQSKWQLISGTYFINLIRFISQVLCVVYICGCSKLLSHYYHPLYGISTVYFLWNGTINGGLIV
jgi:hypothetical protein